MWYFIVLEIFFFWGGGHGVADGDGVVNRGVVAKAHCTTNLRVWGPTDRK